MELTTKENSLKVVQQRTSVFFMSQYIGYSKENAERFKKAIGHEGMTVGAVQGAGIPVPMGNPSMPQLGMPWKLVDKDVIINFLPGKIDVIQDKEFEVASGVKSFIAYSKEVVGKIIGEAGYTMSRLAYAPLFSLTSKEPKEVKQRWGKLLSKTTVEGIDFQNIELRFLLKKQIKINGGLVDINMLNQISDGIHLVNGQKDADCLLLQIDLNTIPDTAYSFGVSDLNAFLDLAPLEIENICKFVL